MAVIGYIALLLVTGYLAVRALRFVHSPVSSAQVTALAGAVAVFGLLSAFFSTSAPDISQNLYNGSYHLILCSMLCAVLLAGYRLPEFLEFPMVGWRKWLRVWLVFGLLWWASFSGLSQFFSALFAF